MPSPAPVRVEGLARFRRDLRRASPETAKELNREVKDIATSVAREAGTLAPRRSGLLAGSYRGAASGTKGVVRSRVFYARMIEFGFHPGGGTTLVPGQEIIGRAIERQQDRIVDGMGDAIERAAKKVGWR